VERGDRVYGAGLRRINLGQVLNRDPLQFAWANDITAPSNFDGKAVAVTVSGGKLWFAVDGKGIVKQQNTYVSSGWIETGRIRLGTME